MSAWPVIVRELRAEARRPFNYWLRVLGAVGFTLLAGASVLESTGPVPPEVVGGVLFSRLNSFLFFAICLIVPTLTADCISRERREGTLGLLFLTPLSANAIAIGKSLIHGLRALTLVIAVLPVLALPLVLGGVSELDIASAVVFDLSAVALGLAAGLIATAYSREWGRALLLAEALALLLTLAFASLINVAFKNEVAGLVAPPATAPTRAMMPVFSNGQTFWVPRQVMFSVSYYGGSDYYSDTFLGRVHAALDLCTGSGTPWSNRLSSLSGIGIRRWYQLLAAALTFSLVVLSISVMVAALQVKRSWQEEPPSQRQVRLKAQFCTPILWQKFFRRRMRRVLDRNPIAWLQQYSWSARLTKWGWCLGLILLEIVMGDDMLAMDLQVWVCWALAVGMALAAASSFNQEKQTGALELILVTPIRVSQFIWGRVVGVWKQFLPSLGIMAWVWGGMFCFAPIWDLERQTLEIFGIWIVFLTIPVIGLYFALRMRHFLGAWVATCAVSLLPLWLTEYLWSWHRSSSMYRAMSTYSWNISSGTNTSPVIIDEGFEKLISALLDRLLNSGLPTLLSIASPVVVAAFATFLLHRNLTSRRFALARS